MLQQMYAISPVNFPSVSFVFLKMFILMSVNVQLISTGPYYAFFHPPLGISHIGMGRYLECRITSCLFPG